MKKLIYLSLAALMALAVSCGKDNKPGNDDPGKYGVDGKTPLPEAVDIGLVVNGKTIKWASFNLGASKEYEYGDYYAWGELESKSDYTWETYKYSNGDYNKLIKYCPEGVADYWDGEGTPDNKTVLESGPKGDDVASKKLGGKWRMPTLDEVKALLALQTNEDYTWEKWALATDGNGRGIRITRKSTGATLFLPAVGSRLKTSFYKDAGSWGFYWSSSLNLDTDNPSYACIFYFNSEGSDWTGLSRLLGMAVRPVCEE